MSQVRSLILWWRREPQRSAGESPAQRWDCLPPGRLLFSGERFHFFLKGFGSFSVSVSVRNALQLPASSSSYPCVNSTVEHHKTYAIVFGGRSGPAHSNSRINAR
jgi:hypothetical protein